MMDPQSILSDNAPLQPYKSWSALADYDGDGTVEFSLHPYTLQVRLAFENWNPTSRE